MSCTWPKQIPECKIMFFCKTHRRVVIDLSCAKVRYSVIRASMFHPSFWIYDACFVRIVTCYAYMYVHLRFHTYFTFCYASVHFQNVLAAVSNVTLFKSLSNHARLSIRELIHLQQLFLKRLPLIIVLTRVQTRVLVRVNACKKQKKEKRSVVKSKNLTTLSTKFKGKNVLLFCYDTIMLLLL